MLGLLGQRAFGRRFVARASLGDRHRVRHAEDDLPVEQPCEPAHRFRLRVRAHGQHDDVRRGDHRLVRITGHTALTGQRTDLRGGVARALLRPGADRHVVPRAHQARAEPQARRAGSSDEGDLHATVNNF